MTTACPQCRIPFDSREALFAHYQTDFHRTNLILHSRHEPVLTDDQYRQLKTELAAQKAPPPPSEPSDEEEPDLTPENCHPIPLNECLFCNKTFDTVELAFEHMTHHGFRFCYPAQLFDPDGPMRYFSEKVAIGHCCINCGKQFKSINAVRDHMVGTSHCFYEFDDEYEDFYQPNTSGTISRN
jgi:pre-60S factor REI1